MSHVPFHFPLLLMKSRISGNGISGVSEQSWHSSRFESNRLLWATRQAHVPSFDAWLENKEPGHRSGVLRLITLHCFCFTLHLVYPRNRVKGTMTTLQSEKRHAVMNKCLYTFFVDLGVCTWRMDCA